jgi:hypothetical protein
MLGHVSPGKDRLGMLGQFRTGFTTLSGLVILVQVRPGEFSLGHFMSDYVSIIRLSDKVRIVHFRSR